jgi:PmbA/TldA metallopeptidase C-terminal domain
VAETLTSVLAYAFPARSGLRVSYSADSLTLTRNATGRVINSVRTTVPLAGHIDSLVHTVGQLLTETAGALGQVPNAPVQSLLGTGVARWPETAGADPWIRTSVIARLETTAGPVVTGTGAAHWPAPRAITFPARLASGAPPRGWNTRPIVLAPQVSSVLMSGARLALTSREMRRRSSSMTGCRIMPDLTIVDRPALHGESAPDDAGDPARSHTLIQNGRLCGVPFSSMTNTIVGRAVWNHDDQLLGKAPMARLELSGPALAWPADPLEVAWCAEGLQRYHRDGTLRLRCLGLVSGGSRRWHLFELHARPLGLLRLTTGLTGAAANSFSDDEVTAPSLVLPSATELEGKDGAVIAAV